MDDEPKITTRSRSHGNPPGYYGGGSRSGKAASKRVRAMLYDQEHLCPCGAYINNGNYFDFETYLACGACAIRARIGKP